MAEDDVAGVFKSGGELGVDVGLLLELVEFILESFILRGRGGCYFGAEAR